MVGNLQQVHPWQTFGKQLRIDLLLHVAHQQESPGPDLPRQHYRHVVNASAAVGRLERDAAPNRPEHPQDNLVDGKAIAGRDARSDRPVAAGQLPQPGRVAGPGPAHTWLHDPVHLVAVEEESQPGHVIFVRVGQDDGVDPSVPRRNASIEGDQQAVRVWPAIDQQASTARALDQDGVALTDVEDGDARHAAGPSHRDAAGDDHSHDQPHGGRPADGSARIVVSPARRSDLGRLPDARGRFERPASCVRSGCAAPPAPPGQRPQRRDGDGCRYRIERRSRRDAGERQSCRDLNDRNEDPQDHPARSGDDGPDEDRDAELDRHAAGECDNTRRHRRSDERDHGEVDDRRQDRQAAEGDENDWERGRLGGK